MNKRDIVNKLKADQKGMIALINSKFASDSKLRLESQYAYIVMLLEWIEQEGKV